MTVVAGTTPYSWPFDGELRPCRLALLLCGSGPAWAARTPLDRDVESKIGALRSCAGAVGATIVLVEEDHPVVHGKARLPDPASPPISARPHEVTLTSAGTDGFYGSALDAVLRRGGITHLLLAGRGFETTVHSTLRRANDRGYECLVVADACSTIDPANRGASISSIEMSGGIFGAVGTTEHICAALSQQALDPTQPLETT